VTTVANASFVRPAITPARSKESRGRNDEYDCDDEVKNLYEVMECGQLVFEKKYEQKRDEAPDPWTKERAEAAAVCETRHDSIGSLVVVRLGIVNHSDNLTPALIPAQKASVVTPIADITAQIPAIVSQLATILSRLAPLAAVNIADDFATIRMQLAPV
jgi:hypothetical protein